MRVIAGSLKGRRLKTPPEGDRAIRPTSDMAREALFSILQRWPQGGFLDLFAGTGAVALEAWSRGYAPVSCLEKSPEALALIQTNMRDAGVRVLKADALKFKPEAFQDLAVIFADPPYEASLEAWNRLAPLCRGCLAPGGVLVWESSEREVLPAQPGWKLMDSRRYGAARFHFFELE